MVEPTGQVRTAWARLGRLCRPMTLPREKGHMGLRPEPTHLRTPSPSTRSPPSRLPATGAYAPPNATGDLVALLSVRARVNSFSFRHDAFAPAHERRLLGRPGRFRTPGILGRLASPSAAEQDGPAGAPPVPGNSGCAALLPVVRLPDAVPAPAHCHRGHPVPTGRRPPRGRCCGHGPPPTGGRRHGCPHRNRSPPQRSSARLISCSRCLVKPRFRRRARPGLDRVWHRP